MGNQLISSAGAVQADHQHTNPCSDCPMRRDSLPGWLGGDNPDRYVKMLHGDSVVPCHVIDNQQCAGVAIYRANVIKRCDPPNLRLPKDPIAVFAWPSEFLDHHHNSPLGRALFNKDKS